MTAISLRAPDPIQEIEPFAIASIKVGPNPLRPLDGEVVKRLAVSMKRIGLMTPITVRYYPETLDGADDGYEIIVGRHRYAAAVSLGWDEIDAIVIECSDVDAKLWEISENLDRAELTQLQRDKQIAPWIELTNEGVDKLAQVEPVSGGRGNKGGVRAAAHELGVERSDANRAIQVASLSNEAQAAAVKHGLDDNRSALLEAARSKASADQVAKIVELATQKTKPKAVYSKKETAAREKAYEARLDKDNQETANAMTEAFIAAGKMSDQQIADFRERGIVPPFRLFSPCGMAFDCGPDAETSCNPAPPIEDEADDEDADAKQEFLELAYGVAGTAHEDFSNLIVDGEVIAAARDAAESWGKLLNRLRARGGAAGPGRNAK
jgi:ParB family chromosome partitioning protein